MSERKSFKHNPAFLKAALLSVIMMFVGCTTQRRFEAVAHPFQFERDTMSYANELSWEYFYDANGKWRSKQRQPAPEYRQHCFVVSHAARQFFAHATFHPTDPKADYETYKKLVRAILKRSSMTPSTENAKVIIPGYSNLREFSRDYAALLKSESGGAWHSYFQRGHWRIMLPFSDKGQEKMAFHLASEIKQNHAPIVHLVRFPQLTINHAALLFDVTESAEGIAFAMYDPNYPEKPATLTFNKKTKRFDLPANTYFEGGRVNVYEIYKNFWM